MKKEAIITVRPIEYIQGFFTVVSKACTAALILDTLMKNGVPFYDVCERGDGNVSFRLTVKGFKKYTALCKDIGEDGITVERHGIFTVFIKYRARLGFFFGALLFSALLAFSSLFIWDINIKGEETLSEDEILSVLSDYGFYIGAYKPSLDTVEIAGQAQLALGGRVSFMTVNLRGTVAEVELHEIYGGKPPSSSSSPSNLIASCDGQIEALEVLGGVTVVKKGQTVRKGQLLVGGIIDSGAVGFRLVRSRGEVLARITLSYEKTIPLSYEEKVPTGKQISKKSIKFFSKRLNLFINNETDTENYDRMEYETRLCLFDSLELPVWVTDTVYTEYALSHAVRTEAEAIKLALHEINGEASKELSDATVLARHTTVTQNGSSVTVRCDIECVKNIAKEVMIS